MTLTPYEITQLHIQLELACLTQPPRPLRSLYNDDLAKIRLKPHEARFLRDLVEAHLPLNRS